MPAFGLFALADGAAPGKLNNWRYCLDFRHIFAISEQHERG